MSDIIHNSKLRFTHLASIWLGVLSKYHFMSGLGWVFFLTGNVGADTGSPTQPQLTPVQETRPMQAKVSSGCHIKMYSLVQITCALENQTDQPVWCHGTGRTEVGWVEQLGHYLPGGAGNLMRYYELLFTLLKPSMIIKL